MTSSFTVFGIHHLTSYIGLYVNYEIKIASLNRRVAIFWTGCETYLSDVAYKILTMN